MTGIQIQMGIPSKGRMGKETKNFLNKCGLTVIRRKREYLGRILTIPEIQLIFQRQKDILRGVENESLSFGIIGYDLLKEYANLAGNEVVILHDGLGFGKCTLELAIPEGWKEDSLVQILKNKKKIRIATKYTRLARQFQEVCKDQFEIINGTGSIEVFPTLGYSDAIIDLVSTGQTIKDNRLKRISGGIILKSQAIFIGNRKMLKNPKILAVAKEILEYFEATIRANEYLQIFANMKESDPKKIAQALFSIPELAGLQGPTISPVYKKDGTLWNAIHIIVKKNQLQEAIQSLRKIGGSGVIVSPALYIFEEEPPQYLNLLREMQNESKNNGKGCEEYGDPNLKIL